MLTSVSRVKRMWIMCPLRQNKCFSGCMFLLVYHHMIALQWWLSAGQVTLICIYHQAKANTRWKPIHHPRPDLFYINLQAIAALMFCPNMCNSVFGKKLTQYSCDILKCALIKICGVFVLQVNDCAPRTRRWLSWSLANTFARLCDGLFSRWKRTRTTTHKGHNHEPWELSHLVRDNDSRSSH